MLFSLIRSALFVIIGWLFKGPVIMFVLYWALFYVASEGIQYLMSQIDIGSASVKELFENIPEGMWWFIHLFKIPIGITMILSAYVTRFAIRRIPIIG